MREQVWVILLQMLFQRKMMNKKFNIHNWRKRHILNENKYDLTQDHILIDILKESFIELNLSKSELRENLSFQNEAKFLDKLKKKIQSLPSKVKDEIIGFKDYFSNQGVKLLKINKNDGRIIQLEAGPWLATTFNKMTIQSKWKEYDINYRYYQQAIEKEINNILGVNCNQLNLFN